jgi:hypothetical protein
MPVLALAKWAGADLRTSTRGLTLLSTTLINAGSVALVWRLLADLVSTRRAQITLVVAYALGTGVWSVATRAMWQHGPAMLVLAGALVCFTRPPRAARWLLGSALLGLMVANRPGNAVLVAPIVVWCALRLWRERRALVAPWLVVAALPIVALLVYSHVVWGDVINLPIVALLVYSHVVWGDVINLGQGHHWRGVDDGDGGRDGNLLVSLGGLLLSPSRGLLIYSPFFLFALVAAWRIARGRTGDGLARALVAGVTLLLLLVGSWHMWWGGWSFGYRLLLDAAPALIVLSAYGYEHVAATMARGRLIFVATVALAVFVHGLGAFFYPCGFNLLPDNIDQNTARLWSVTDNQIARCVAKARGR